MAERETVYNKNGYKVEWNGSATFNIFRDGKEIDVWTEYGVDNVTDAKRSAESHMASYHDESDGADGYFKSPNREGHWYTR